MLKLNLLVCAYLRSWFQENKIVIQINFDSNNIDLQLSTLICFMIQYYNCKFILSQKLCLGELWPSVTNSLYLMTKPIVWTLD